MDGIDVNAISAYAAAAAAVVAAVGLWYNAIQTKTANLSYKSAQGSYDEAKKQSQSAANALIQSANVFYYQILNDFTKQIEDLEGSEAPKGTYRSFALKYLSIFDRLVYLHKKNMIGKEDLLTYFEDDFRIALGLLEMKEFSDYKRHEYLDLTVWCQKEEIKAVPPTLMLPDPDIRIENGSISP